MKDSDKIRILIVEDEPIVADDIQMSLEEMGYAVQGIAHEASEALEMIRRQAPDLLLLDIDLEGEVDGIDLAHQLPDASFPIIFLTSYADRKTIERVKVIQPAGYIVKPFDEKDLLTNIELALYKHLQITPSTQPTPARDYPVSALFFVKVKHQLRKISPAEILWVEGADNYSFLHTASDKFLLSSTLKKVEDKLKPHRFLRVHKSYVIALDQIETIEDDYVFIGKKPIPVGKVYKRALMEAISLL